MFCQSDFELKVAFDWVAVYSASTPYEAHMVKANLESANIPAMVLSQSDRMYYMTLGNLAVAEVMVPKTSYEEAKQFLQALEGGDSIADNDGIHD
jgi:predicted negative regulator of RcsB-dependent stress response